jgi:hypothetical protein
MSKSFSPGREFLVVMAIFAIAWSLNQYISHEESKFVPIETHLALAAEVAGNTLRIDMKQIQARLWQLEGFYDCIDPQSCTPPQMPAIHYREYQRLTEQLRQISQKLGGQ